MEMDAIVALGFKSEEEFHKLVSEVDLSDTVKIIKFKDWQHNDGTKEGLMKLQLNSFKQ